MSDSAALELSLRRWPDGSVAVEPRLRLPAAAADVSLAPGPVPLAHIDAAALLAAAPDADAYGRALTAMLCADPRVAEALLTARAQAEALHVPLRLRLRLDSADDALHALRWETLQDPRRGGPLAASERVLLSRALDSAEPSPPPAPLQGGLRALAVVAAPPGLDQYGLAPIDLAAELARARAALAPAALTVLGGPAAPATLAALTAALRDGPEILYLVAHGAVRGGEPYLWLDDGAGGAARIPGDDLADAVAALARRPRLAALVSCASAGATADGGALAALGPRLAAAGLAAVVAMRDELSQATAAMLLPALFAELRRDGVIDRALAAARAAILGRPDWWAPTLYMRPDDGRIWAVAPATPLAAGLPPPPDPARPPELPGFVGRAAALAAIGERLRAGPALLVGMPGSGKTSLAAAFARRAPAATVFWHSFHPGDGLDALAWSLAGYLAHRERPEVWELLQRGRLANAQPPPPRVLLDYLLESVRALDALVCLDDLHHVADDPLAEQLVLRLRAEAGPGLRVLATSRTVPDFADTAGVIVVEGLPPAEAALLAAGRGIPLAPGQLATLHAQTGGNPQLLVLALDALARGADPARLLADLTAAPDVERFLLREVDAGLSGDERRVLAALAVQLGYGATRPAVEALLDGASARRPLRDLADRGLVAVADGPAGREHRLHAIVARFYYDELGAQARAALHRRAAAVFESDEPDRLRAALHYGRAGDHERAARLATEDVVGALAHGQARALAALLGALPEAGLEPELRARVALGRGQARAFAGDVAAARDDLAAALAAAEALPAGWGRGSLIARACVELALLDQQTDPDGALALLRRGHEAAGSPALEAELLVCEGTTLMYRGDYEEARATLARALASLGPAPGPLRAAALLSRSAADAYAGDYDGAEADALEALAIAEALGDKILLAKILTNLGLDQLYAGRWPDATATLGRALALADDLGDQRARACVLLNLGLCEFSRGDHEEAEEHLGAACDLAERLELAEFAIDALCTLGELHTRLGRLAEGRDALDKAETMIAATGNAEQRPSVLAARAELLLALGEPAAAVAAAAEACALVGPLDDPVLLAICLRALGAARVRAGDTAAGLADLERSVELTGDDDPYEQARSRAALGAHIAVSDPPRAAALLAEARMTFERLGARYDLERLA
jgi:tetratricopeptide (TPR) repeat protein